MQITMKQAEIEQAVRDYITKMGMPCPVGAIDFTATRGAEGITASLEISDLRTIPKLATVNTTQAPAVPAATGGSVFGAAADAEETGAANAEKGCDDEADSPLPPAGVPAKGLFG